MQKCKFSDEWGLCTVKVLQGTVTRVTCDGLKDRSCAGYKITCPPGIKVEDIRDRKPKRSWGGRRIGAGAPQGNLNRLVSGGRSKLLRQGIAKLAEDPEMRAVLLIIARLATEGVVPASTKKLILKITQPRHRTRRQIKQLMTQAVNHG